MKNNNNRDRWASLFYWIGAIMTGASIALVLLGNTKLFHSFQHTNFPLAWKFAGVAVVSFLAREICRPSALNHDRHDRDARRSVDHIPHEI
jgi:hypothetical protein